MKDEMAFQYTWFVIHVISTINFFIKWLILVTLQEMDSEENNGIGNKTNIISYQVLTHLSHATNLTRACLFSPASK
jgi:hypothetical protein